MPFRPAGFERFQGLLDQTTDVFGWSGTDESIARSGDAIELQVNGAAKVSATGSRLYLDGHIDHVSHVAASNEHRHVETAAIKTTNATATVMWSFTLPSTDCSYWVRAFVTCKKTLAARAFYMVRAHVFRNGGGAAFGSISPNAEFTDESAGALHATFTVSSNDVRLEVTGQAATDINWAATIEYQGVLGA